ncbi:LPXTG cell wall anchor domain-containing protein [Microbacterium deminutum]|uniref:VWFA domain-containing protein n=1 Tax=Microbacterium deminutum TaxID=344164 RepID=A0ABP5BGJ5_9MICO
MFNNARFTRSDSPELGRERERLLVLRHRWYAGGVATLISAALIFTGVGSPALADTTPTPTPTDTAAPTPPADATTPPADDTATPTPTPTPPADATTPPAGDTATPTPTPTPTTDGTTPPADATPTPTPTPTDPADSSGKTTVKSTADALGDVVIATVPAPGATTAVITVKVGSDRTGITGVTPLAGRVLLLNTGTSGPSGTRPDGIAGLGAGWALCTSDAQGDCSFTVPETQAGPPAGVNRDARFWVVGSTLPAGYYSNPTLRTGDSSGSSSTASQYTFRTGDQLRANTTYSSQNANDFMLSSGAVATASGGIWQQSRNNPVLPASCGLDVALILDLSGSVAPSLPALKTAANTFVDSLQGTPSRMSLFSFSTISPADGATANFPNLTPVTTPAQGTAFKNRYATWTATGTTNWDRGLGVAAAANSVANNFDIAVVITDGNPTSYNQPSQGNGSLNRFRETENGIFSANALKEGPVGAPAPTRVITFGVGGGATGATNALNIRAISGPIAYNGSNGDVADYYQTTNYAAVGTALRNLALGNCQGTLTVTKQIVPSSAPVGSITGAVPAGAGWQFTSAINPSTITTPSAVQTTTADGTGTVNYPLTFPGGTTTGAMTVTEAQQSGFTLQPVTGQNAVCMNLSTTPATAVPVVNVADGFTVEVDSSQAISCTVYNRAPNPPADITVSKTWVINGVTYANGAQPSNFSAQLQLTGPGAAGATDQGWDVTRTGYSVSDQTTLSESVTTPDPAMCSTSSTVTNINGTATSNPVGAGFPVTLSQEHNTATITNTVDCRSTLTLLKQVQNGSAAATSWTLNASFLAIPPINTGLPGFSGASGSPAATSQDVTPDARYQLFETGGDPRYVQTDNRTNLQSNPLSTGSATCIRVDATGAPWPGSGFSDGINGGVNVPLGYRVACTFVNQTASLTLLKNVVNDNGGTQTASAWSLTATPATLTGLTPTTVAGSEGIVPASTFEVRPDHVYTLTESTVPGYQFVKLQQFVGGTWVDVVANSDPLGYPQKDGSGNWQITVAGLDNPVYRFVNDDVAPMLTLVKTVTNDNGGTAVPTAWTLTATTPGGPNLTGATGSPAVTAQPVQAGVVYTIGESGPAAYNWTNLSCTGHAGATQAAPTLTLAPGENVRCTLNNDDILVPVTIVKSDGVVQQLANGDWSISYDVTVTNTSATLPTTFSLTDVPTFDSSFTILTQGWQGSPDVTDVPIAGGGTATYTYVVTASTNKTPVDPTALVCTPASGGGFFNTATVTFPGGTNSDTGCAIPAKPVIQKTALPSTQNTTTGAWTLSYTVEVSNPSTIPLAYTLDDTAAALPAGVTGGAWAASDPVAVGGGTFVRNAAWAGSGELATGTLPAGASHTYTVSRAVMVAATVPVSALTCGSVVNEGGGVWNTATVTNGLANDDSSACADITPPDVTIQKHVTSTSQLVDGTWRVTYDITVTNTSADLAAVYSLSDTLRFGGDIAIVDVSWTGPTTGTGSSAGQFGIATNRVLAPSATDTYTVTVLATINAAGWDGGTLTCQTGATPNPGGFLNIATVTVNGTTIPANDCSEPALPTIAKAGVSAVQDASDPDTWVVSYDVTVTSGGLDTFYSLSDTPAFAAGITLGAGTAQRTDIAGQPVVPITSGADFATDVPLPAGATHVYRVSWTVVVTNAFSPNQAECTGTPGSGFFNTATLTVGDIPIDGSDCIPVANRVYPTITKTVTSTNQDPATGWWTTTYDLVVTLAPQGPANPDGLSAKYDLVDTLDFGGDINVISAMWSGESSGTFVGNTGTLATGKAIAAGATHTYTVTAVAEVTAAAVTGGTTACVPGETPTAGGFLNTALLSSGGQDTPADACAEPIFPEIDKSPTVGTPTEDPATGHWTVSYDITVTYPATTVDPQPVLGYVLTDTPALPAGVELIGDWTAAAANGDTPAPDNPTFNGTGTWTIVNASFDPAANGVTQHVYTVTAEVNVTRAPTADDPAQVCDQVETPGWVVVNTGTVTSGGFNAHDDACEVVQFEDVGIQKTTSAPGPFESGDTFDYVLTVTNLGTGDATDLHVSDPIPSRFTVTAIDLSAAPGWSNDNSPALVGTGNTVNLSAASLAFGASAEIRLTVTVNPSGVAPPPVQNLNADDPVPTPPPLPQSDHVNTACVEAAIDADGSNNCDSVTVQTKDITAVMYTRCVADAPLIGFVLGKTDNLASLPVNFAWQPDPFDPAADPTSVTVTYPGGTTTVADEFPWVGTQFTPSGISTDYPGWRPLQASDYGPGGGYINPADGIEYPPDVALSPPLAFVFNGLILDPSELDYAWRFDTTATLSVNPSMTFEVSYPPASEACVVARHSNVQIEKDASVTKTDPGKSFTYTLATHNVSDDSAADGVVVTDAIPSDIKITDVTWPGKGDATVFPNWTTCAVTGQNASGYGGTLTCDLFGPLQPVGANSGASAAPTITLAATVNPASKASVITNVGVVDYYTFGHPTDTGRDADDATVALSTLPATGASSVLPLVTLAILALLVGAGLLIVGRRRRSEAKPTL